MYHCSFLCTFALIVLSIGITAQQQVPEGVRRASIPLEVTTPESSAGSMIAADVDTDGAMELLVTAPGYLGAYETHGARLWSKRIDIRVGGQSESQGLPGHHGPGVQAADIDEDGAVEVLFLTQDDTVHVLNGSDGEEEWSVTVPHPDGAERWEHLIVATFRDDPDPDILLQATNADGYRMGRYVAAFRIADLKENRIEPLWQRDDFLSCAHNGARVADIDGDGCDEILGGTILDQDGEITFRLPVRGHLDSIYVGDVRPDVPGLEVVALEEGGHGDDLNRVFVASQDELLAETHFRHQEPQNAAIGDFDPDRDGLEIWCRSRYSEHQKPFVFDARGDLIFDYEMDHVAPQGWTDSGVEVINCIDWTGGDKQLAAAKERHTEGDICVFDPMSGEFIVRIPETAARLYVADVLGDWREEIIVWNDDELHIYQNAEPAQSQKPRLWQKQHYRRSKQTWNYYSP